MTDQAVENWDGEVGERWLKHLVPLESMISPVNEALLRAANFAPDQTVVEIGCGGGKNAVDIARAVTPSGSYLGVDISEALVAHSKDRAAKAGAKNVSFLCADAEAAQIGAPRDRAFSSFGVMFFNNPEKAFANIRGWVKSGGDFTFSCWAPPDMNPWVGVVGAIVGNYVDMPGRAPDQPGPFRMADPEATTALLGRAGWKDVDCNLWRGEQFLGGEGATPESAAEFVLSAMSVGDPLKKAGPDAREKACAEIGEALKPFYKNGAVRMQAASWIVTAKA